MLPGFHNDCQISRNLATFYPDCHPKAGLAFLGLTIWHIFDAFGIVHEPVWRLFVQRSGNPGCEVVVSFRFNLFISGFQNRVGGLSFPRF